MIFEISCEDSHGHLLINSIFPFINVAILVYYLSFLNEILGGSENVFENYKYFPERPNIQTSLKMTRMFKGTPTSWIV